MGSAELQDLMTVVYGIFRGKSVHYAGAQSIPA